MNEPIILEIGIDICLTCPYSDCIGTSTELCHLMKNEVRRIKTETQAERDRIDQEMIDSIMSSVAEKGPLSLPELREIHGYPYEEMDRLVRIGKLEVRRVKKGKQAKKLVV